MKTTMTILRVGAAPEVRDVDLPERPHYDMLVELITPILDGGFLERVRVWHEGKYTDLFCDEDFRLKGLERNEAATGIYRSNVLTHETGIDPESLPDIRGTAVLFDRAVWF